MFVSAGCWHNLMEKKANIVTSTKTTSEVPIFFLV
jgi:hypothetical protein